MEQLRSRSLWIYACILLCLLITSAPGLCQIGDESGILPCIPDVSRARSDLDQRRGAAFIAQLQKVGDKYVRNGDYQCLYDLLRPFDDTRFPPREARHLLFYRILAQQGLGLFIGAHIDYDWLVNMRGVEADPDFAALMENRFRQVCAPTVAEFRRAIRRHPLPGERQRSTDPSGIPETLRAFLIRFSAERIAVWDYLTLRACWETIDIGRLTPSEKLIVHAVEVMINLKLSRLQPAYNAWMQYRQIANDFPEAVLRTADLTQAGQAPIQEQLIPFFTITQEKIEAALGAVCPAKVDCCDIHRFFLPNAPSGLEPLSAAIAHLETQEMAKRSCTAGWLTVKQALEKTGSSGTADQRVQAQFWLAKADRMLGDSVSAHRRLLELKRSGALAKGPQAEALETMLAQTAPIVRKTGETRIADKLADVSRIFYYTARNRLMVVTAIALGLIFFFLRWNASFKETNSGVSALLKTLGAIRPLQPWLRQWQAEYGKRRHTGIFDCRLLGLLEDGNNGGSPSESLPDATAAPDIKKHSQEMMAWLSRYAPYPICLISRLPGYKPSRHFWYYTILGAAFSLLATWTFSFGRPMTLADHTLLFFLLTATLVAALTGIRIMTRKTLQSVEEIATMLGSVDALQILGKQILLMFRSPWQFFIAFLIYGIFFTVSANEFPSTHLMVILIILILCPIHWMMVSSLIFTRELCNLKDLAINPLSPLKTWGLQRWISVIGTFATTGSIIITFSSAIPVIMRWETLTGRDLIWLCAMLPLLLAYWIYPYFRIRSLVREFKLDRMNFIKTNISQAYDNWHQLAADSQGGDATQLKEIEHQMDRLSNYHKLFKVIDQSPEFFVDIYSVLELAKVMGFPSLFALIIYLLRMF